MTQLPYRLWRREADVRLKRSRERRSVVTEAGAGLVDYTRIGVGIAIVVVNTALRRWGRYVPATVVGAGVLVALLK